MKKDMHNMKFKNQLYIAFTIVIVLVSILIISGLYLIQWNNYRKQAEIKLGTQAKQIAINIDNKMDYYMAFAKLLVLNTNLIQALEKDDFATAQKVVTLEIKKLMDLNIGKVNKITLYRNTQNELDKNKQSKSPRSDRFNDGSELIWTRAYLTERNEKVFSMYQKVFQTNLQQEYYLEVCIYETELSAFFNKDHSGFIISIMNDGMLMSSSDREYLYKTLIDQDKASQSIPQIISREVDKNVIHVSAKCKTGWDLNIDQDMSYISRNFLEGFFGIVPVILVAIAATIMFISVISKRLSNRMNSLHKKIDYISQWELTQDLRMDGNDEFKILADALDETRQRILSLIAQINNTNELKRISEMTALRSQIKSHFLFNSLSTIKWLSRQNNQQALSEAVDKLSYILRYSLSLDEDFVLLSSEVEHLKSYIYLEKLRYHEGVRVHIDIGEELMSCKTVKLILQPLVENSIYHGRREDGSTLNITIYSYTDENNYYLVVEDDGNGMQDEKIHEMYTAEGEEDEGYGLKNVLNRVRMCTGDSGSLTIQSKPLSYTKTTIRQPKT